MSPLAHKAIALFLLIATVGVSFSPLISAPKPAEAAIDIAGSCATTAATMKAAEAAGAASAAAAQLSGVLVVQQSDLAGKIYSNTAANNQNNTKQNCLNAIAWYLAKVIIDEIVQSTVRWINSGFQGSPAFVANPGQFFLNVADENFVGFMNDLFPSASTATKLLCSPFSLDLQLRLALRYAYSNNRRQAIKCRVSDIISNVGGVFKSSDQSQNDFLAGDFNEGGWDRWLEVTQVPSNNKYGSFILAADAMDKEIADAQHTNELLLNWGRGVKSATKTLQEGLNTIVTPGATIENALAEVTTSDIRQLELADEFNEIVGALMSQMMKKVFAAGGGLSGLSETSSGSSASYIDQLTSSNNYYATSTADFGSSTNAFDTNANVGTNLALGRGAFTRQMASGSSLPAARAVDGFEDSRRQVDASLTYGDDAWWDIDMGTTTTIKQINILPSTSAGGNCGCQLRNYYVIISDNQFPGSLSSGDSGKDYPPEMLIQDPAVRYYYMNDNPYEAIPLTIQPNVRGRYVRIQRFDHLRYSRNPYVALAEVKIFGTQP